MNYHERARKLATRNTKPSLTDQSQAKHTDLHVIVNQYLKTGQVHRPPGEPITGDFTHLEGLDLADLHRLIRNGHEAHRRLPKELAGMSTEELLALTPEQLTAKLTPAPTPTPTTEEEKK